MTLSQRNLSQQVGSTTPRNREVTTAQRHGAFPRSNRRTIEVSLLASVLLVAVWALRFFIESRVMFSIEVVSVGVLVSLAILWPRLRAIENRLTGWKPMLHFGIAIVPILTAIIGRLVGHPIAHEMAALTAMGTTSLAIALSAQTNRLRSMSMVISGFMMLFVTSISDSHYAILMAVLWMTICVWHLITNHWERLDVCLPDAVHRDVGIRPITVLVAVTLCVAGGLLVRNKFGESQRYTWGFMPTSGGSDWSDPAARSGVGSGDAAIAAKDHAESFGAVESDIFLEATGSTLFDMFSDSLGQPKIKAKSERRQGLTQQKVIEAHTRTSKSEKGSGSFSTNRNQPVKHEHLRDATERAVLQWAGPTGIRLAMNRFDTFDGTDWTQAADHRKEKLWPKVIDQRTWFFDPEIQARAFAVDAASVGLLKILRLDSIRIPTPMMTAGLNIKDIDRIDFFGIEKDGSYYMPGREKVPPLTVFNLASLIVMEDELLSCSLSASAPREQAGEFDIELSDSSASQTPLTPNPSPQSTGARGAGLLALARGWTTGLTSPYEKLEAIVHHLRTDFTLDRDTTTSSDEPIAEFLETKRGGEHLFATTAALMAREIGLESRLVTGFYVSPKTLDVGGGHTNVLPEDTHAWVEIRLDQNRWFEVEPSPGYREPIYKPSYWLLSKRFATTYWPYFLIAMSGLAVVYATVSLWVEFVLRLLWSLTWTLNSQRQMRAAMWIIEARAGLAKRHRPLGRPQRDWLIEIVRGHQELNQRVHRFCDAADQASFGKKPMIQRSAIHDLVASLTTRTIKQLTPGTSP